MMTEIIKHRPGVCVCAIKVERVRRLVLLGVRTCLRFEEGILHSWMGGLVARPLGLGVEGVVQ